MSKAGWRAAGAAGTVLVGALIGLATNFLTDRPSWGLAAGVAGLVLCGAVLAAAIAVFDNGTAPATATPAGNRPRVPTGVSGGRDAIYGDRNRVGVSGGLLLGALLVLGATAVAVIFVVLRFGAPRVDQRSDDRPVGTGSPSATSSVSPTADTLVTLPPTDDFTKVVAGQCIQNNGTEAKPNIEIVKCERGVFYVLRRVDGTAKDGKDAIKKCAVVPDYTKWYFYDHPDDALDFVLCLRGMPTT